MSHLITVSEVNNLFDEQFEWMFGNVIELCTDAAVKVKANRPFGSVDELYNAFASYLDELSENEKIVVLKLHPDLAGRLAASGELTRESTAEQRSAGLDCLSADQATLMDYNNEKYKAKFGFPFIICARENKISSILEGLQQRYNNTLAQEVQTGITEVKKICRYKAKFGFPFIICARENKISSILEGLQQRYNNTLAQEVQTGITEVKKICRLRILDIVKG